MEMGAANTRKAKTGKSALGLIALVVVIAVAIIAAAYALTLPGVMENLLLVAAVVIIAIAVIAVVAYIAYAVLGIAYYASKGEEYQENVDYDLEDVKPVRESSSEDKKNL